MGWKYIGFCKRWFETNEISIFQYSTEKYCKWRISYISASKICLLLISKINLFSLNLSKLATLDSFYNLSTWKEKSNDVVKQEIIRKNKIFYESLDWNLNFGHYNWRLWSCNNIFLMMFCHQPVWPYRLRSSDCDVGIAKIFCTYHSTSYLRLLAIQLYSNTGMSIFLSIFNVLRWCKIKNNYNNIIQM